MATNIKLPAQSGLASWASDAIPVGSAGWRMASITVWWSAVAATSGTLSFEGTDDPDKGVWVPLTVATSPGTFPAVSTAAAQGTVILANCPGWIRVKYTRSAGGAAGQFNVGVTLTD